MATLHLTLAQNAVNLATCAQLQQARPGSALSAPFFTRNLEHQGMWRDKLGQAIMAQPEPRSWTQNRRIMKRSFK